MTRRAGNFNAIKASMNQMVKIKINRTLLIQKIKMIKPKLINQIKLANDIMRNMPIMQMQHKMIQFLIISKIGIKRPARLVSVIEAKKIT